MAVEFELAKSYRGFSLQVPPIRVADETLVLFGPSGSGKTQTLLGIAGIVEPDSGRISLDGETILDSRRGLSVPAHRRCIGYVPQSYALFPHLSVAANIGFGLTVVSTAERRDRIAALLDTFGLATLADRRPAQLSGGQQQRVALARALATEPRLLLLDEPFAALDSEIRGRLRAELAALRRDLRLPIILVSHDRADVFSLADRVAVMAAGRIVQIGTRDDVFRRPASTEVARLTGNPNLLAATIVRRGAGETVIRCGELELTARTAAGPDRGPAVAVIRPEVIQIVRDDRNITPPVAENQVAGQIVEVSPEGYVYRLRFRPDVWAGRDDLIIVLPSLAFDRLGLAIGQRRTVAIAPDQIHLLPPG